MIILVDTREKQPLKFPPHIRTESYSPKTGDYSVKGYEDTIAVERKSLGDLGSCLCDRSLPRFSGQLQRMRQYPYRALLVEATVQEIYRGRYGSPLPPNEMVSRLMDVVCRFKILLFMVEKKSAPTIVEAFFKSAIRQVDLVGG